ncbi:MAG: nitroreductase family protein [Candidatus Baldrarchaeia archaeon]
MSIIKVIREKRSVREFLEKDVPDELIMKVLDAARWAPSSKNTQPWEFIIIRDQKTKKKLAKLAKFGWFIADAPVVIAIVTDPRKSYAHIIDVHARFKI